MASISVGYTISSSYPKLDNTPVNCVLTIETVSRSNLKEQYRYRLDTYLGPYGYTYANYETYDAVITVSGTNITTKTESVRLKNIDVAWTDQTHHYIPSSTEWNYFDVTTTSNSSLSSSISLKVTSSKDSSNSLNGSTTLSIPSYVVTPTAPTTVSGKTNVSQSTSTFYIGYNPDASIALTVSGGSNVSYYERQVSVNGGGYTACNATYTPSTKTNGTTYQFRARSISVTGNASAYTTGNKITCAYRPSTAPSSVSFKTGNSSTTTIYIGYNPDTSLSATVSGGTNISSYSYQYQKNSGTWTNVAAGSLNSLLTGLASGDTLKLRVRILGLNGSYTSYTESNTLTVAYRASTAPSSVSFKTGNSSTTTIYVGDNPDTSLSATISGGTNISSYDYQYQKNSGTWTNIAAGSLNSLLSGLASGNTLKLRVRILGLNGSYTSYTESNTLTVAYRASSPFTSFVISGNVGKSNEEFYMGDIIDTAVEGATSGGTNISSIEYQYKKNSDSWTTCTLPLQNSVWNPAEGDTIQLRARILGLNGSYTAYTESNALTVAAMRLPGFYVTYNGVQQYITDGHFKLKCAGNIMQTDVEIEFASNWKAPVQDGDVLHIT